MKKINLLLAIHNHQPVGNFDFVFREAYERAYKPFLDVLERHPRIKISLHFSGVLLSWFEKELPGFISRISRLVAAGQVELLTGAFYEPILAVLPEEDRRGQIQKLSSFIRRHFGTVAQGMWLAERVWEQSIARSLAESGVKFVPLDDAHFFYAGLRETDLLGYYMTEESGKALALFPTSKKLRYIIPFRPVKETIEYLRSWASEDGTRVMTFGDDGEKFGVWPTTHKHVYEDGWLSEFFGALDENSDWISVRHFTELMREIPPIGRIYLPTASYPEMMHWVLPAQAFREYEDFSEMMKEDKELEQYQQFVRGGFWRNFFVKYPEGNVLHKKMLRISERAHRLEAKKSVKAVLEYLWAGQCNDAYWHGIFGGLYLPHLRTEAFRNLLRAENALNRIEKGKGIRCELKDFDCDGRQEILLESSLLNLYLKPDQGGSIFELDHLPTSFNVSNVMTRREEGYHRALLRSDENKEASSSSEAVASIHDRILSKEENLGQYLAYDWYRRASLLDHFLDEDVTLESFSKCKYAEQGDFVNQPYQYKTTRRKNSVQVDLWRDGHVWQHDRHLPLTLRKTLTLKEGSSEVAVEYRLENPGTQPLDLWYGIEFCFALSAGDAPDRYYRFDGETIDDPRLQSAGTVEDARSMALVDEWVGLEIKLEFEQPATVWRFPIETISMSEAGFERVYQGSIVFPNWRISLSGEWRMGIRLELKKISRK